jgi:HEAT repeat protein
LFESDEFKQVRYAAAFALGKIKAKGAAQAALRGSLESRDELLRTISAWALARTNPQDQALLDRAVRLIVDAFKSDDVHVRRAAARAVVEFKVNPEMVAPALVDALEDADPGVVANAIEALSAFGAKALQHVDDALENEKLRQYAVRLIARVGPDAASAVPALIEAMRKRPQDDDDVEFLREAQFALGAIGPGARKAVPALVRSLSSDNDEIRASAAYALGRIGPGARAAVPALQANLKSPSEIVNLTSVLALMGIQPERWAVVAAPRLSRALDSEFVLVRVQAASALGALGERRELRNLGKRAVPRLRKLREEDENELVRQAATDALQKLGVE